MSYSHVQGKTHSGQSGTTLTLTFDAAVTSGNPVTGVAGWVGTNDGTDSITSILDDKGNSYPVVKALFLASSNYYWVAFRLLDVTNSPSTITLSASSTGGVTFGVVIGDEWGGVPSNAVLNGFAGASGTTGTTQSSGNFTANSGDLLIGYAVDVNSSGLNAGQTQAQYVSTTWLAEYATAPSYRSTQAMTTSTASDIPYEIIGFAIGTPPVATAFHVANSGNDSNPGTLAQPWQTVGQVNSSVFMAGDQVLFQGGQTFPGSLQLTTTNYSSQTPPTSGSPLVVDSYGTGNATIAPSGLDGALLHNIGSITLQNLTFAGDDTANYNGAYLWSDGAAGAIADITFLGLRASGFGRSGILGTCPDTADAVSNVTVQNCTVTNCTDNVDISSNITAGICFGIAGSVGQRGGTGGTFTLTRAFDNVTISGCTVGNCPGTASSNSPYQSSTGIFVGNSHNGLVTLCYVHDCGANEAQGNAGIEYNWTTGSVVSFCEVYNQIAVNAPEDGDGVDFDVDCHNCTVEYCYIHHCDGAGIFFFNFGSGNTHTGCTARFNILESNAALHLEEISVWNAGGDGSTCPKSIAIYNNTVYCTNQPGSEVVYLQGNNDGVGPTGYFANNLIRASGSCTLSFDNQSCTLDGNCYYGTGFSASYHSTTYSSLAAYQAASSQEAHSLFQDPKLVDPGSGGTIGGYAPPAPAAYHLQGASRLIGAGRDLAALYSINPGLQDFYGNPVKDAKGFSIGAYTAPDAAATRLKLGFALGVA
jgi:hypothetical protein